MIKIGIQFFGGRGGGGSGGARGGGRAGGGGSGGGASSGSPVTDPMLQIEAQVNATEAQIEQLRQRQKSLDSEVRSLVRARNYAQIKLNNRESERLENEIRNLEKKLTDLHRRGRALSRD